MALARRGVLPRVFGTIHPTYQTPYMACLVFSAVVISTCAVTASMQLPLRHVIVFAANAGGVLVQLSYLLVMLAAHRQFSQVLLPLAASLLPIAAIVGSFYNGMSPGIVAALLFAII